MNKATIQKIDRKLLGRIEKRGNSYVFVPLNEETIKTRKTVWLPYKEKDEQED